MEVDGRAVHKELADALGDGSPLELNFAIDCHALWDRTRLLDRLLDRAFKHAEFHGLRKRKGDGEFLTHIESCDCDHILVQSWLAACDMREAEIVRLMLRQLL